MYGYLYIDGMIIYTYHGSPAFQHPLRAAFLALARSGFADFLSPPLPDALIKRTHSMPVSVKHTAL